MELTVFCCITSLVFFLLFRHHRNKIRKELNAGQLLYQSMFKELGLKNQEELKAYSNQFLLLKNKIERMEQANDMLKRLKQKLIEGVESQSRNARELRVIAKQTVELTEEAINGMDFVKSATSELFALLDSIIVEAALDPDKVAEGARKIHDEKYN